MRTFKYLVLTVIAIFAISFAVSAEIVKEDGVYKETVVKEFDVTPGGTLMASTNEGSIKAVLSSDSKVHVTIYKIADVSSEERAKEEFDNLDIKMEKDGNDVIVKIEFLDNKRKNKVDLNLEVSVPANYNSSLSTGGGSIKVSDLIGDVSTKTGGGSIALGNITGKVNANTGGGSIKIGDIKNGFVKANTGGGSISIDNVEMDVNANSGGGSISVAQVGGSAHVNTGGGSIVIGPTKGDIVANTGGGSIKMKEAIGKVSANSGGGSINVDGSGGEVSVNTGGGSINIDSAKGKISASTGGGSIMAKFLGYGDFESKGVKLVTGGGKITLYIPADLKATINAKIEIDDEPESDIISEFSLKKVKEDDEVIMKGDINGGGPEIFIRTADSDIEIKKLK